MGLTPVGYESLCDLRIVRSYIHRNIPHAAWGIDPASGYFQDVWDRAQAHPIRWPGFRRMQLSDKDRAYLEGCLKESGV